MYLYNKFRIRIIIGVVIVLCMMISCIPSVCSSRHVAIFKNCTDDTLLICVSRYDCIDSILLELSPLYRQASNDIDTITITQWEETSIKRNDFVFPDSLCVTDAEALFVSQDTCYFFLVKWNDAKNYSWDEIRAKKLYKRWITTKNKDGDCDRNIRYNDQQSLSPK